MGYDFHGGLFIHRDAESPIGNTFTLDQSRYHESYDWLIPVIIKLHEVISEEDQLFRGLAIFEVGLTTDFETLYQLTLEAINFHKEKTS